MKKKFIAIGAAVAAAFVIFFALQATPKNVLNQVRADSLDVADGVITVPEQYTVIEAEAFAGKIDFNKLVIKGKTEIGDRAFYGCTNLRTVVLEKDCEVGEEAFADCSRLETLNANSAGGTCADSAFDGHGALVIYCRENSEIFEVAQKNDISYEVIE